MGHRFGPDLVCSECGTDWELHQLEQKACEPKGKTESPEPTPLCSPVGDEEPE